MKRLFISIIFTCMCMPVSVSFAAEMAVDISSFERIPVQYKGRIQPLKALAIDVAEMIYGRKKVGRLSPSEFVLELLVRPDHWYGEPVIRIDHLGLKESIGLPAGEHFFSMEQLNNTPLLFERFKEVEAKSDRNEDLLPVDRKIQAIQNSMSVMGALMSGELLRIIPPASVESSEWLPLPHINEFEASRRDTLLIPLRSAIDAFEQKEKGPFQKSIDAFSSALRRFNREAQPASWKINWEMAYYSIQPFRLAWVFYLVSGILFVLAWRLASAVLRNTGVFMFAAAFAYHTAGMAMRIAVLGRPPVSNMYESVVFMAWCISLSAMILSAVLRKLLIVNTAAFAGATVLIMGSLMPFDSGFDVLVPVLRSNYWLTIHVMTIVSSYSLFALAAGLSHASLGFFIFSPGRTKLLNDLTHMTYRSIQVGVILLAAGTVLGGVWANESWGRFWGWDPKETWALISLLGYLAVLHARHIGWLKGFGLAVGSVACFLLILMTWYGVNFVLGKGLHSYGFGNGGGYWISAFVAVECGLIGWSWLVRKIRRQNGSSATHR